METSLETKDDMRFVFTKFSPEIMIELKLISHTSINNFVRYSYVYNLNQFSVEDPMIFEDLNMYIYIFPIHV